MAEVNGGRVRATGGACAAFLVAASAPASINLELRPVDPSAPIGFTFEVELHAVSDDPRQSQAMAAAQVLLGWDPDYIELVGLDTAGAVSLLSSSFPIPDPHGLNESSPPADGDAFYMALAPLGTPVIATPAGTLITTFQFKGVQATPLASIEILARAGSPPGQTMVFDGMVPNLNVVGTLLGAEVAIFVPVCPADVNGDGTVDVQDLVLVVLAWDTADPAADVNDDSVVDVQDLVAVVLAWGPC